MKTFVCLLALTVVALARPQSRVPTNHAYELEQNRAAKYEFNQDIDDKISDLTHQRSEKRDGLAVQGMYSYSDGFHKRTVHYVADEKGYRVTGMEAIPLSNGPKIDLGGTASVSKAAHGTSVRYVVKAVPPGTPLAN